LAVSLAQAAREKDRPVGLKVARYLLHTWLPRKQISLRPSTWDGDRRNIESQIVPRIGRIPLRRLRGEHIDSLHSGILANGRVDGKGALEAFVGSIVRRVEAGRINRHFYSRLIRLFFDVELAREGAESSPRPGHHHVACFERQARVSGIDDSPPRHGEELALDFAERDERRTITHSHNEHAAVGRGQDVGVWCFPSPAAM
jgi:hypothetical protein